MHIAKGWTPEEVEADIASEGFDFDDVIAEERAYIEKLKRIHESKDAPSPTSVDSRWPILDSSRPSHEGG